MVKLKRPLCLMPLMVGCYSYTPITPTRGPRARRFARESRARRPTASPLCSASFDTRVLVGNVVENNAGAMMLQVPMGAMPNVVADIVPLQTRIPLSAADLVSLEQRKLDVGRTSILAGAIVAGIGIGVAAALHAGGGSSEEGRQPTEPPPIKRIPIWRFHF